jgi:hypothetical protein
MLCFGQRLAPAFFLCRIVPWRFPREECMMTHSYRYLIPVLLVALVSACSEDDTPARPDLSAGGSSGATSVSGGAGTASSSSSGPSSAAAGASSADRPSAGASLGNSAGQVGSQGSRGGGRFRDDPAELDAGVADEGDADVIDAGDIDAGDVDAGDIDASAL